MSEKIHILGIAGTFMAGLAIIAREAGYDVTGVDAACYPPVSDLLNDKGITYKEGYHHIDEALSADTVVVGNAMKRGIPVLEAVLDAKKNYTSGPEWLLEHILYKYRVIAVSGTHGKTTTTSMVAHILQEAGLEPGFLIGGVAPNFGTSARLGKGEWFVIEADEYDTAFFDKRPKFMHYRPEVAILNNLEFDHADIYPNLEAIQLQFHYFLRTIPSSGTIIKPLADAALNTVIEKGLYSKMECFSSESPCEWQVELHNPSGECFSVWHNGVNEGTLEWQVLGEFNAENAVAAIAASHRAGVPVAEAIRYLQTFKPAKRRLEVRGTINNITVYDDFAHHPTAIAKTIAALKASQRHQRILLVMEFASYTMRSGVHVDSMGKALAEADKVYVLEPAEFSLKEYASYWTTPHVILSDTESLIQQIIKDALPNDAIIIMSNRGFENIHIRLLEALKS